MRREIGIYAADPLVLDSTGGQPIYPSTYNHVIDTLWGYRSATFTFGADQDTMDEWIQRGMGRHIVVYDDALCTCWEGFVSKVSPVYGSLNLQVGPLLDAANKVALQYSGIDMSVNPPAQGVQITTSWVEDTDSQDLYGIIAELLSTGGVNQADAQYIRNSYLQDMAYPPIRQDWTSRGRSKSALRVDCLGYYAWLIYPYNQVVDVGMLTTDAKIRAILLANPNSHWMPFGAAHVDTPPSPSDVTRYEFENIPAMDLIKNAVAVGDANAARWLFGVYDGREAWYWQAPTTLGYYLALNDPAQRIVSSGGQEMEYPDVRPGKWLLFSDFLAGAPATSDLRRDPRTMFIESVTYTMPRTLALKGGKFDTLSQTLARLGLGGL